MSHHYQVVPECYADTLLVEMLGFVRPNHQLGIGKVFGAFDKNFKNRQAVGIIDDDKVKPKDLDNFEAFEENHGIKRLKKDYNPTMNLLKLITLLNWLVIAIRSHSTRTKPAQ